MKYILFTIIILFVSSFTGCMMMGGMMHKTGHNNHTETTEKLIKEVEISDYRITAEFPPLFYNTESVFQIKIYSLNDSIPSTATVRLLISEFGHDGHFEAVQLDKDSNGNYSTTYLVKTKKDLKISYIISELEDIVLKKPIEIEAERSVHTTHKSSGMWMHDIGTYAVVSGVIMLTMMVFMIGRVF
ncbi:MAG: hypothetical protein QME58_02615 [Bacteroidota bacterium]|nr:hypothetical protein [Bacteroidota bacterium]